MTAIEYHRAEGVGVLRLNRPDRRNALDVASYRALTAYLHQAADDDDVAVLVLTGVGQGFCAGNDLDDFVRHPIRDDQHPAYRFMYALAAFPKPVVAAVEGAAVGIGCTLLLHCDLLYAGEGASFQMPFVQLGLCPEFAATALLPALVGLPKASEWLLHGRAFDAREALAAGLLNDVVDKGDAYATAMASAQQLAASPREALLATKALLRRSARATFDSAMAEELTALVRCQQTRAFQARLAALVG
ncbi:enoyl-CoA hydratase-related protein [Marinobacter sp. CA1]|uniref:enoyl-CoA hydratase-related protein n=1 Tax=Marinobacter sp. CA1 TaxID=2817656 RepID=UPI001D07253A|nr:enoyl-CoA hydratase-related protein [Marinobacter sp. CA1]UDL03962.1 enoyl-CoA hydratase/isomerase family protein [Marinobacter sp. CA1]